MGGELIGGRALVTSGDHVVAADAQLRQRLA